MSDARRARAERRAAIASPVTQTAPVGGRPRRSLSPAVNAATGPAGNEQQALPQHLPVRRGDRTATLAPPVVAALLGGSQVTPTSRHVKPFVRRVGAVSARQCHDRFSNKNIF